MKTSQVDAFGIVRDGGIVLGEKFVGGDERKHGIANDCNKGDGDGCGGLLTEDPEGAACITPCHCFISIVGQVLHLR